MCNDLSVGISLRIIAFHFHFIEFQCYFSFKWIAIFICIFLNELNVVYIDIIVGESIIGTAEASYYMCGYVGFHICIVLSKFSRI